MTSTGHPGIAVIIVNYGTAALTVAAVDSVLGGDHGGRSVEVHVVDNASPGGDATVLRDAWDARGWEGRVTLHLEQVNHGFGRGNNLVLEALTARPAPPDKVFFLNPDARLVNDAISLLADFLDIRPQAAVAGARIERPESGTAVSAAFRFPNAVAEITSALGIGALDRVFRHWQVPLGSDINCQQVDWVSGACFMARTRALREVGFFRKDFFLYFEEVDLMKRLRDHGWEVWYRPDARVEHVAGAATGQNAQNASRQPKPAYWYDSWRIYYTENHGTFMALLIAAAKLMAFGTNRLASLFRGMPPRYPLNAPRDHLHLVIIPLIRLKSGTLRKNS